MTRLNFHHPQLCGCNAAVQDERTEGNFVNWDSSVVGYWFTTRTVNVLRC